MDTQPKLSSRQLRVIPYLLVHNNNEACRLARVSRKALWQWQQDPAFQEELKQAREAVFDAALGRVKSNIDLAVDTLVKLTQSGEKEETRLRGAAILLERSIELRRLEGVEGRLASLEEAIGRGR